MSVAKKGGAVVVVRRRGATKEVRDARLARALRSAFAHHRAAKDGEGEVRAARACILRRAKEMLDEGRGTVTFEAGGVTLSVTPRYEAVVDEGSVGELRRLLGPRFRRAVRVKKSYLLSSGLAGDESVAGFVTRRELSPAFRWGA